MSTHENVIYLRRTYPELTLEDIGDRVGVTKVRVHTILKQAGLPTKAISNAVHSCGYCHKLFAKKPTRRFCRECKASHLLATYTCDGCGNSFKRKRSLQETKTNSQGHRHIFCSRRCYHASRYLTHPIGKTYF